MSVGQRTKYVQPLRFQHLVLLLNMNKQIPAAFTNKLVIHLLRINDWEDQTNILSHTSLCFTKIKLAVHLADDAGGTK